MTTTLPISLIPMPRTDAPRRNKRTSITETPFPTLREHNDTTTDLKDADDGTTKKEDTETNDAKQDAETDDAKEDDSTVNKEMDEIKLTLETDESSIVHSAVDSFRGEVSSPREEIVVEYGSSNIETLSIKDLRKLCTDQGLSSAGKKNDLIARLRHEDE